MSNLALSHEVEGGCCDIYISMFNVSMYIALPR